MSQAGKLYDGSPLSDVETITGNVGGVVGPDALLNIDVVGTATNGINTTGNPAGNSLTIAMQSPFGDVFEFYKAGTAKTTTDILTLTNRSNAVDMDSTGTGILFNQWYYDAGTPAVVDAGRISVITETDWTSTASTQDSKMLFQTVINGILANQLSIASDGIMTTAGVTIKTPNFWLEGTADGVIVTGQVPGTNHRIMLKDSNNGLQYIAGSSSLDIISDGNLNLYPTGNLVTDSIFEIVRAGTVTSTVDFFEITNTANNASMTATGTGILFNQYYYDAGTPAVADAGRLAVITEGNWTSTASTQDSRLSFQTALDGTVSEQMTLMSVNRLGIGTSEPMQNLAGGALGYGAGWDGIHIKDGANAIVIIEGETSSRLQLTTVGNTSDRRNFFIYNTSDKVYQVSALDNLADAHYFQVLDLETNYIGFHTLTPSAPLEINWAGTIKANTDLLMLSNESNAADMDGTSTGLVFSQSYYTGTNGTMIPAGRIAVVTETDWTSTASTQDSMMQLSTALNGTVAPKMTILSSGYTGIGVTDPDVFLEVFGAGTQLKLSYDADSFAIFSLDSSDDLTIKPAATGGVRFQPTTTDSTDFFQVLNQSSGTTILNVDSTNRRVGIGTATPSSLLDLEKNGELWAVTDFLELTNTRSSQPDMDGTGTGILFNQWYYDASSPAVADAGRIAVITETDWTSTASTQDSKMSFQTCLNGTVAPKMTILSSGFTGIGEEVPLVLFHLKATDLGALTMPSNNYFLLEGDGNSFINLVTNDSSDCGLRFGDPADTDIGYIAYSNTDDGMIFGTNATDQMKLDSIGRLGIGTITPSSLLDLEQAGTVTATVDFLELTNFANAASMTGTGTGILFNQWYYDGATPAVAEGARISFETDTNWTSTTTTHTGFLSLEVANGYGLFEGVRIGYNKVDLVPNGGAVGIQTRANGAEAVLDIFGSTASVPLIRAFKAGTLTSTVDFLEITNTANNPSMTATGTGILFNQSYYDAGTPAVVDAGRIAVVTEGNWTSTASTQDAKMSFLVAQDGDLDTEMSFDSDANLTLKLSDASSGKVYFGGSAHGVGRGRTAGNDVDLWTGGEGSNINLVCGTGNLATFNFKSTRGTMSMFHYNATINDEASFSLPNATAGFAMITFDGGADYAFVTFTNDGVVILIANSANVVNTDTDGKYCVFDGGTSVSVKNRIGSNKNVKIISWSGN